MGRRPRSKQGKVEKRSKEAREVRTAEAISDTNGTEGGRQKGAHTLTNKKGSNFTIQMDGLYYHAVHILEFTKKLKCFYLHFWRY